MSELLPCPFCGGEARPYKSVVVLPLPIGKLTVFDGIKCMGCGAAVGMTFGDRHGTTEAEAAAAWNTRHVETCKRFWTGAEMVCSKCGYQLNSPVAKFCPSCGRRVER